ncbi:hypothetical protein GCM10025865_26900 [Paraoerskovia sediminicola]|uniref:4'-phosphopantetheinyl transferase n=1 Tax=Paraoerskovia sediminicola TaxID=1138587 RepID=A0ABN6XEX3_9CELL|nr:hypothetical protein [Paraoerskovia sediminicola]BDZ43391.1 hypothetical protein GCM10025865_26900 [Paraoerskovia sediminicola]
MTTPPSDVPSGSVSVVVHASPRRPLRELPLDRLTSRERWRLDRYRQVADKERFATARTLAREALGALQGIDPARVRIDVDPPGPTHGRVSTPDGPAFSIAHAGGIVLVAVLTGGPTGARVGVDIDHPDAVRGHLDELSDAVPPAERPAAGWSVETFTRAWVRREAALKAVGCGLLAPRDDLVLGPADAAPAVMRSAGLPGSAGAILLRDLTAAEVGALVDTHERAFATVAVVVPGSGPSHDQLDAAHITVRTLRTPVD